MDAHPDQWRTLAPVQRLLSRRPRVGLAVKAALAAALAWLTVALLPGSTDYPYYAPLGAVIAVSSTVAGSVRESVQGLGAILLGVVIARSVDTIFPTNLTTVAVVVLIGVLVGGWSRLGSMSSWVPISALFVLIIGSTDPFDYVVAYGGFTMLGAAIGVGLNLAFPPLPLVPTEATLERLRDTIADQLRDLADGLRQVPPPSGEEWEQRQWAIEPVTAEMRTMIQHAAESRRGNRRAGRYRNTADLQYQQARALERLTFLVEDLTLLIAQHERGDGAAVALGPSLREPAAEVIERLADVLRSVDGGGAESTELQAADEALARLVQRIRADRSSSEQDLFVASSIVVSLRRCLGAVVPADLAGTIPST